MIIAWIIAVWLLSLVVFVALRAFGTRRAAGPKDPSPPSHRWTTRSARLPRQRDGRTHPDGRPSEGRMTERR